MNRFIQKFLNSKTLVLTFLLIIGFSLYANSFSNKFFWDDDDNVVNNIFIKNWKYLPNIFTENLIAGAGLQSNYYRPLLLISYAFDYRIWGLRPFGYHLANTLLHILNAFLIFIIINFLIRKKTVALLTSILFLVHPLQTEVVTYMAGRADPLFVFFLLLAFWFFIKFNNSAQKKFIFLSFLFFIFSLLSKEMAIVFPVLLILYLVCFKERKINPASCSQWSIQSNHCSHEAHYPTAVPPKRDGIFSRCGINWLSIKKIAISIWPFLLIALIYFILRLTILNFGGTLNLYQEENLFTSRLDIRLFTFLKILLIYYKLIFAPIGLHMDRSIPLATTIFHWQVLLSLLILIGIIIGLIKSWQKQRLIFFAFGWFFINLLPTSNIIPVSGLLYEHWLYLPSVGIFLLGAILVEKIWSPPRPASLASLDASRSGPVGKRPAEEAGQKLGSFKWLLPYFMMIYLIWFSFLTVKRNFDWHDPITFYEKNLRYVSVPREYNNLGNAYADKGKYEKAIISYQKAIELGDIYPQIHYNLANSYRNSGRKEEAIVEYKKAILMDKNFTPAYYNLSSLYLEINQGPGALEILLELEKISLGPTDGSRTPQDPRLWHNLGVVYYSLKNYSAAIQQWQKILFIDPNNPIILNLIKSAEAEQQKQASE